jgi:hypothetical protein
LATSYTVFDDIDFNSICAYITQVSGSDYKHVYTKPQIQYLKNYLQSSNISASTVLLEHEYVDKFYLEDFTKYFASCFFDYKKKTARIHFFGNKFNESQFKKILETGGKSPPKLLENIKSKYLGFVVVRPIPKTFLATTCLVPYRSDCDPINTTITIKKHVEVNIFGIELSIDSLPYQEQDKVVSACATTALWVASNAPIYDFRYIPSPSQITQEAFIASNSSGRSFPNEGLNPDMMVNYFHQLNLETYTASLEQGFQSLDVDKNSMSKIFDSMNEMINAYSSCGLPIILGLDVFQKDKDKQDQCFEYIGKHAVTITGYKQPSPFVEDETRINDEFVSVSDQITEFIVHDDQIGPYAKVEIQRDQITVSDGKSGSSKTLFDGEIDRFLKFEIDGLKTKYERAYLPSIMLIALPPKVRIKFQHIKKTCLSFNGRLKDLLTVSKELLEYYPISEHGVTWSIQLKTVNAYKSELFNKDFDSLIKERVLSSSCPKFVWVASAFHSDTHLFDFLFDATGIEQGGVFIDSIFFDESIEFLFSGPLKKLFERLFEESAENNPLYDSDSGLISIAKKMIDPIEDNSHFLDTKFGLPKPPAYLKNVEIQNDAPIFQPNVKIVRNALDSTKIDSTENYIWAICQSGFLHIGKDIEIEDADGKIINAGHPTLSPNLWARIAGNLEYKIDKGCWVVNNKSGRFSQGNTEVTEDHLINARKLIEKLVESKFETFETEYLKPVSD